MSRLALLFLSALAVAFAGKVPDMIWCSERNLTQGPGDIPCTLPPPGLGCEGLARAQFLYNNTMWRTNARYGGECLESVPVDIIGNSELIDEIKLFLEWNSNTAYLKNLPTWYDAKSMDLFKALDQLKDDLMNIKYPGEAAFQLALSDIFASTGDTNFMWRSDINSVFHFYRNFTLVAFSDGNNIPQVYDLHDMMPFWAGDTEVWPEPVAKINSKDVLEVLEKSSRHKGFRDRHARWNHLFGHLAWGSNYLVYNEDTFKSHKYYDGEYTFMVYLDGRRKKYKNRVDPQIDFYEKKLGYPTDLMHYICKTCYKHDVGSMNSASTASMLSDMPDFNRSSTSRVFPDHRHRTYLRPSLRKKRGVDNVKRPTMITYHDDPIQAWYMNGEGYDDIMVLDVHSFSGEPLEFQKTLQGILESAERDKKKRLIIDHRSAEGGFNYLAYELFKQLFPCVEPYDARRFRAHEAYKRLSEFTAYTIDRWNSRKGGHDDFFRQGEFLAEFYNGFALTTNDSKFASQQEFYGPHTYNGDNFTTLSRTNLDDHWSTALWSINITGHGTEPISKEPLFKPENIVLLSDGICSGACAMFSDLMRRQLCVKTIAIGGYPDYTPMQVIGGARASLSWELRQLGWFIATAFKNANKATVKAWKNTPLGKMYNVKRIYDRTRGFSFSVADGIGWGDETGTPLQFVYEEAECRIWYTMWSFFDHAVAWTEAVDRIWGDKRCVTGTGFGHPNVVPHGNSTNLGHRLKGALKSTTRAVSLGRRRLYYRMEYALGDTWNSVVDKLTSSASSSEEA